MTHALLKKISVVSAAFVLSAMSHLAVAATDVCQSFAKAEESQITTIKSVNAYTQELSEQEKSLVHTTILIGSPGEAATREQALAIFRDDEHEGSLGGDISYNQITLNNKVYTIVRVTHYPGDNEYGALFLESKYDGVSYFSLLGQISDSDISCMSYVD